MSSFLSLLEAKRQEEDLVTDEIGWLSGRQKNKNKEVTQNNKEGSLNP